MVRKFLHVKFPRSKERRNFLKSTDLEIIELSVKKKKKETEV